MTTTARLEGDHYVLNGYKAFVTNGPIADVVVVYAKTSAAATADCASAFLVETTTPGLTMGPELTKVGLKNSPLCELGLVDCKVPAEHMIGEKGAGFFVLTQVMQREILYSFVINIGEMKRRLGECVRYARSRKQFGLHIGAFQAVSNMIADMKIRYELGRSWLYQVAERVGANKDVTSEIAISKVFISESSISTAIDALHLHGGRGYIAENGFGSAVCDALAGAVYSGTNDIQRGRIAAMLGVGAKAKAKAKDKPSRAADTDLGRDGLAASAILAGKRGFCLHKAIAFVAVCRAAGLSARLLADKVKNHVTTTELSVLVGGQDTTCGCRSRRPSTSRCASCSACGRWRSTARRTRSSSTTAASSSWSTWASR